MLDRRAFLTACAALACSPALARATAGNENSAVRQRLAAAWQGEHGYQVGILQAEAEGLSVRAALDVPTRAHALYQEPDGTLLAIARRPGDWLLRWDQTGQPLAWCWIEPRRAFTGHVVSDGNTLYIAETDLDTGAGLIGVRDAKTLEKRAEWPTHGIDPHQLLWDARQPGALIVANGGVPTRPETGRAKVDLDRMDSSLVRIDAASGEMLGQWRLDDRRLSLRHLAWSADLLGIALQAEHDDAGSKATAPVLALFDGERLRTVAATRALSGYGGDIAAFGAAAFSGTAFGGSAAMGGFAVSCPRARGIALFDAGAGWRGFLSLDEACPLTATPHGLLAGGMRRSLVVSPETGVAAMAMPELRMDNHWIALGPDSAS